MPKFESLRTDRLIIRNWSDADRPVFRYINCSNRVMHFFPFRRTPTEADALMDLLRRRIEEDGFGFTALELASTGECIGFCGLSPSRLAPLIPDGSVEIGWRLVPEYWGKGYASEAALALLEFGFNKLLLPEIISFAVATNERSIAVMRRIGMRAAPDRDFDHPDIPDTHPHLTRHVFYSLTRNEWMKAGQ